MQRRAADLCAIVVVTMVVRVVIDSSGYYKPSSGEATSNYSTPYFGGFRLIRRRVWIAFARRPSCHPTMLSSVAIYNSAAMVSSAAT